MQIQLCSCLSPGACGPLHTAPTPSRPGSQDAVSLKCSSPRAPPKTPVTQQRPCRATSCGPPPSPPLPLAAQPCAPPTHTARPTSSPGFAWAPWPGGGLCEIRTHLFRGWVPSAEDRARPTAGAQQTSTDCDSGARAATGVPRRQAPSREAGKSAEVQGRPPLWRQLARRLQG